MKRTVQCFSSMQLVSHSLHSHTQYCIVSQSPQRPQVGFEGGEVVVRAQQHVPVCPALRPASAACLGSFDEWLVLFQANLVRWLWCWTTDKMLDNYEGSVCIPSPLPPHLKARYTLYNWFANHILRCRKILVYIRICSWDMYEDRTASLTHTYLKDTFWCPLNQNQWQGKELK